MSAPGSNAPPLTAYGKPSTGNRGDGLTQPIAQGRSPPAHERTAAERAARIGLPAAPTTLLRLGLAVLGLAAFVVVFAPTRLVAKRFGMSFGSRLSVRFQRLLCAGLGVRVRRHGELAPRAGLIVANHVSWLDIPVLGSLAPMSFLAKKEVGDHPLGRRLVALQGAVYVDRGLRFKIPAVNADMARTLQNGSPVVLFAEATTGDGNRLLPFRSSHFEALRIAAREQGRPALLQPVFLAYSRLSGLPVTRAERPRIAWYGDMMFLPHLFGYADRGALTCDVHIGAPISVPSDMHRKTAARLAEAAVRRLAAAAREQR